MSEHRIQNPLIAEALQALLGIKGKEIISVLRDDLSPVIIVGDTRGSEPTATVRAATASQRIAGVAGQFGTFSLDMSPGTLAIVKYFSVTGGSPNLVRAIFDSTATAPGSVATEAFTDTRLLRGLGNTPFGQVLFGTQAANIAGEWRENVGASPAVLRYQNPDWVIFNPQGNTGTRSIVWQYQQVNSQVDFVVEWDEYSLVAE